MQHRGTQPGAVERALKSRNYKKGDSAMAERVSAPERRHVTPDEAKRLFDASREAGRNTTRDRTLLMMMYYHGLRVAEAIDLRWHDVDWSASHLHVRRVKNGVPATH